MLGAWLAEYVEQQKLSYNKRTHLEARLKGYAADKDRLAQLGLSGLCEIEGDRLTCESWDSLTKRWQAALRNELAAQTANR